MKTKLQQELARVAPHISIETIWEHDEDSRFSELTGKGMAFENEDPDDWQAWQSEIRAVAIEGGELRTGRAFMGGTWEKEEDNPHLSNPTISGYEAQMTEEALEELAGQTSEPMYAEEIGAAIIHVQRKMLSDYEAQMRKRNN